jgi:hypothetical protein
MGVVGHAGMPCGRRHGQGLYSHESVDVHAAMCLALRLGWPLQLVSFVIAQLQGSCLALGRRHLSCLRRAV